MLEQNKFIELIKLNVGQTSLFQKRFVSRKEAYHLSFSLEKIKFDISGQSIKFDQENSCLYFKNVTILYTGFKLEDGVLRAKVLKGIEDLISSKGVDFYND